MGIGKGLDLFRFIQQDKTAHGQGQQLLEKGTYSLQVCHADGYILSLFFQVSRTNGPAGVPLPGRRVFTVDALDLIPVEAQDDLVLGIDFLTGTFINGL